MLLRAIHGYATGFPSRMIPDSSSRAIDRTVPVIVPAPAVSLVGQSSGSGPKLHSLTKPNQTTAWVKPSSVEKPSWPSSTQASSLRVPSIVVV